ncbi:hypothetical protein [Halomonas sp. PR-M31]|uniref:hypothetical protein n=1 Tax=Halomonas sp. PR-M31 TaxID=1471202 RepID=UPI0006508AB2|nr:hypothetical protein [Halomonas sp. PR-M31]
MSNNITRVPVEQVYGLQLADLHVVGAVGRHDDSHRYIELMNDPQHMPLDGTDGVGETSSLLLVEVDDPNDPECLRNAIDVLMEHEYFEQRHHHFKQY